MTAPLAPARIDGGAPEADQVEAARAAVRAKFKARQAEQAVRQAAQDEERKLRRARRAAKTEARRLRREESAERAADTAGAAGWLARRAAPVAGAAVPVVMVNATAFVGQFAFIKDHVPWILPGQILVAATFESVAVYLSWHAHVAMMKNDSSTRLKLGAQLFALIMGAMNYSHYASHWHPTVLAVGLGLMSLLSPSLWGIYSRRAARDKLMARGLVEEHAVRLGANRWTWHPFRSVQVMWRATWIGENDPKRAIALYEDARAERRASAVARQEARSVKDGAPGAVPAVARQAAPEVPAPVAQEAVPASGAPALPAAPAEEGAAVLARMGYSEEEIASMPIVGEPGSTAYMLPPGGPADVIPGTRLNGAEVRAIAALAAKPKLSASHPIDPERTAEVELHLAGLPADGLPAERTVSGMLCPGTGHNHRRQAAALIKARKDAGPDPLPAFVQRQRPLSAPAVIASPVDTLPGGKQANG